MKPEDIEFLESNRHHFDTLVKAFYLRSLSGATRERMQNIIAEYFQKGYTADLFCPTCCAEMVKKLYRHYDEWLEKQPITVAASFPSNKNN